MATDGPVSTGDYSQMLSDYCSTRSEAALYHASLLGQRFVESNLGPDDIIALHTEALEEAIVSMPLRQKAGAAVDALQFLLEVMIAYGVHHQRYLELRLGERARLAEAEATLERERAHQAEQADLEKSEILSAIAHEFRTPLTAAHGLVQLALRSLERDATSNVVGMLVPARDALNRLSRLSSDLAEASRGGLPELQLTEQELGSLVAQACTWANSPAAEKGITLTHECEGANFYVRSNADALLSILGNLLSNAIRYTPSGGRVTVRCSADDEWVTAAFEDTGIGMTEEVRRRIFEKFYRSPEGRALESAGLGLGLALTRQLVLAHGGQIQVESTPGVGSCFRVLLPKRTKADKEK